MSKVSVNLRGFVEAQQALGELTTRMVDAAARKAVRRAAKPVVAQARANLAALNLKDSTGLLSRSIGIKVKKYRARNARKGAYLSAKEARIAMQAGITVAIIGARRQVRQQVQRQYRYGAGRGVGTRLSDKATVKTQWAVPANYAHLIEKGARPHTIGKGASIRKRVARGMMHPGFAGRPWLQPAIEAKRNEAMRIMRDSFAEDLRAESARARAKINGARGRAA